MQPAELRLCRPPPPQGATLSTTPVSAAAASGDLGASGIEVQILQCPPPPPRRVSCKPPVTAAAASALQPATAQVVAASYM